MERFDDIHYTPQELMVVCAARQIRDGEVVFVGMRLPLIAFALAKRTRAKDRKCESHPCYHLCYDTGLTASVAGCTGGGGALHPPYTLRPVTFSPAQPPSIILSEGVGGELSGQQIEGRCICQQPTAHATSRRKRRAEHLRRRCRAPTARRPQRQKSWRSM